MLNDRLIRNSSSNDFPALELLYTQAFPEEDLIPLVKELLSDSDVAMSLVATIQEKVVAHAVFTMCNIPGISCKAALLGPLAVDPSCHRQGIGSAIVHEGLERLARIKVAVVFVLGDPAYYSRFGFKPDSFIEPPYSLPEELRESEVWQRWKDAWQSKYLAGAPATRKGTLSVPSQWQHPELWAP